MNLQTGELSSFAMKTIRRNYSVYVDVAGFALVVAALVFLLVRGSDNLGYNWHWQKIPGYLVSVEQGTWSAGPLAVGLLVTLQITAISLALATVIGLLTSLLRLSRSLIGRWVAIVYLESIRNTPLLVQIFFLYFVMAPIFDISRFSAAVIALSLFEGAYASEIFRAGIVSIPRGQWEASYSLGLSNFDMYRKIILPQAIRRILPPLTSQAISLIKDSALVSTIAVYDLTMQGRTIIAETFLTFEIWFTVAALYLILTLFLSLIVRVMQNSRQVTV